MKTYRYQIGGAEFILTDLSPTLPPYFEAEQLKLGDPMSQIVRKVTTIKTPIARKVLVLVSAIAGLAVAGGLAVTKSGEIIIDETIVEPEE